jgi:RimJ/RimL family protein N-acetyltransferase
VVLRPLAEDDLERIVTWRNAARTAFIHDGLISLAGQRAWYARQLGSGDRCFIIETRDGVPVGMVCLYGFDHERLEAELGRMLLGDERFTGRGVATEACRLLLEHARELGLRRLRLQVLDGNARAVALYERVGFAMDPACDEVVKRDDGTSVKVLGMSIDLAAGPPEAPARPGES